MYVFKGIINTKILGDSNILFSKAYKTQADRHFRGFLLQ
jgi:hypothetical protein